VRGAIGALGHIIRNASGLYDVPDKAERMPLALAVNVALGLEAPPSPAPRRAAAGETRDLEAALTASLTNARPGPEVHQEPHENWELRQGDRIMRHLALYGAEGADVQTMSAGMHDMPTTKIRAHLRKRAKVDNGPGRGDRARLVPPPPYRTRAARVKLLLVIPPCGFCWDRDAVEEAETVSGCVESLCPICADKFGRPGTGRRLVTAAAAHPRGSRCLRRSADLDVRADHAEVAARVRVDLEVHQPMDAAPGARVHQGHRGAPQVGTPLPPLLDVGGSRVLGDAAPGDDPEPAPPGLA
jgi:hypothetical protein